MPGEVDITIVSHPRWLRLARSVVQDFCAAFDIAERQAHLIVVAVDEAMSNVMEHAYGGDRSRFVSLSCRTRGNALEFEIRDQGIPFNPLDQDVPATDDLRPGGRGLYLIRKIMDRIEYRRDGDSNCFRLSKTLDPPAQPAQAEAGETHGY